MMHIPLRAISLEYTSAEIIKKTKTKQDDDYESKETYKTQYIKNS